MLREPETPTMRRTRLSISDFFARMRGETPQAPDVLPAVFDSFSEAHIAAAHTKRDVHIVSIDGLPVMHDGERDFCDDLPCSDDPAVQLAKLARLTAATDPLTACRTLWGPR